MSTSIVIPTHNRSALLRATLNSVLGQRPAPHEVIVVDDGSTDDTAEVVASEYPGVRYIWQKNQYLGAARETGRRAATGDYLLFVDDDDLLLEGALEALESALESDPAAVLAYGGAVGFSPDGPAELPVVPPVGPGDETVALVSGNFIRTPGMVLIRRSALERAGPWDPGLRGIEDWDMWIRLSVIGPFARLPRPVLNYRMHGGNMSSKQSTMDKHHVNLILKHSGRDSVVRNNRRAWKRMRRERYFAIGAFLRQVRGGQRDRPAAAVYRRMVIERAWLWLSYNRLGLRMERMRGR